MMHKNLRHIAEPLGALVGVIASIATVLIFSIVFDALYQTYQSEPIIGLGLPACGLLVYLFYKAAKVPMETSTAMIVDTIKEGRTVNAMCAPAIFIGSCLSALTSASVGKEAGALQIGGVVAASISRSAADLTSLGASSSARRHGKRFHAAARNANSRCIVRVGAGLVQEGLDA